MAQSTDTETLDETGTGDPGSDGTREWAPVLLPNEVVADRFLILRLLGRGGMGEVYEAQDQELGQRVALKVARSVPTAGNAVLHSLKQEVLLVRRVVHPNIRRVYDVFFHQRLVTPRCGGQPEERVLAFIVMELLEGETLAQKLERERHLELRVARPVVEQILSALAAAHAQGVLHLDLKASNIVLVPDGAGSERAVLTDFGIGVLGAGERRSGGGRTWPRVAAGTPPYAAPEQASGGAVSEQTDIYSFGVVLYQVLSGGFPRRSKRAATGRRVGPAVQENAPAPTIAPAVAKVIGRCLEPRPEDRFSGVDELAAAFSSAARAPGPRAAGRWRTAALVLALAGVAGAVAVPALKGYLPGLSEPQGQATVRSRSPRPAVAILELDNSGDQANEDWIGDALGAMLVVELGAGSRLRVAHSAGLEGLGDATPMDLPSGGPEQLIPILRDHFAVDYAAGGRFEIIREEGDEDLLVIDVDLWDTRTQQPLATIHQTGRIDELVRLAAGIAAKVRSTLGVDGVAEPELEAVRALQPEHPTAARLYVRGVRQLRGFELLEARRSLQAAVDLEPDFGLARMALAEAWVKLGYDARAAAEARAALEGSEAFPRETRLALEARLRGLESDWPKAIELCQALCTFYPDDLEYGLMLVEAQTRAGLADDAMQTLDRLRGLPLPMADDPRIYLAEATIAQSRGDCEVMMRAARRAADRADARGAQALGVRARVLESEALWVLGQVRDAEELLHAALQEVERSGDVAAEAAVLSGLAKLVREQGDTNRAIALQQRAIARFREVGSRRGEATAMRELGVIHYQRGEHREAVAAFRDALAAYQEIADQDMVSLSLNNIGGSLLALGELAAAREAVEQALAISRGLGDEGGAAFALSTLGSVLFEAGDLVGAETRMRRAIEVFTEQGHHAGASHVGYFLSVDLMYAGRLAESDEALGQVRAAAVRHGNDRLLSLTAMGLGRIRLAQGRYADARRLVDEGLRLAQAQELTPAIADNQLVLAELELAMGRFARASMAARQVRKAARQLNLKPQEALAWAVGADALARSGHRAGSMDAVGAALSFADSTELKVRRLEVLVHCGRALTLVGEADRGRELLDAVVDETQRTGILWLELEARLAGGEALLQVESPGADEYLEELEAVAGAAGFEHVASRARETLRR